MRCAFFIGQSYFAETEIVFIGGYFSAIYIRDFEKGSLSLAAVQECREYNRKT
jgi:hypothetical protein